MPRTTHLPRLDYSNFTWREYKSWSSSLCNFLSILVPPHLSPDQISSSAPCFQHNVLQIMEINTKHQRHSSVVCVQDKSIIRNRYGLNLRNRTIPSTTVTAAYILQRWLMKHIRTILSVTFRRHQPSADSRKMDEGLRLSPSVGNTSN
jgi:hypothetical protein